MPFGEPWARQPAPADASFAFGGMSGLSDLVIQTLTATSSANLGSMRRTIDSKAPGSRIFEFRKHRD